MQSTPHSCLSAALFALFTLALPPSVSAAPDCATFLGENQRHARATTHLVRTYSQAMRWARDVEDQADRIFADPADTWRATAAMGMATFLGLGGQPCRTEARWETASTIANASLLGGITYRPLDLRLTLFAVGRMDALSVSSEALDDRDLDALFRVLVGANVQVTRWFSVGVMQGGRSISRPERADLRSDVAAPETPWLIELGVPRYNLFAVLAPGSDAVLLQRLALDDVPISRRVSTGLRVESVPTEDRWLVGSATRVKVVESSGPSLDLEADFRVENAPGNLRHVRVSAIAPMLKAGFTRRQSYGGFGGSIEQRAFVSLHRGAEVRRVSGVGAAIGGGWETAMRLESNVLYLEFLFGVGINRPEQLDLLPGMVNALDVLMGLRVGNHW